MNKKDKPTDVELKRGVILPSELTQLLQIGAPGASSTFVMAVWNDDRQASVTNVSDMDPLEDAEGVESIHAEFRYSDESTLTIRLRIYSENNLSAVGDTARQRQSAIA